ncbi:uncharacterized protein [Medicago truncatula]|uniref:uncharacterized protein isoform X2 n=1 Tax=Medicago truncatula TaxID=3880 RepID=UPI000D2F1FB3|nr:uncharacterized protein LOC25500289 isoform X2 [Medicago truncatula]
MTSTVNKFDIVIMFIFIVILPISTLEVEEDICKIMPLTISKYACDKSACNLVCMKMMHATYEEEEKICEINYHHTQSEYGCDKSSCNEVCINIEHATYAKQTNKRNKQEKN